MVYITMMKGSWNRKKGYEDQKGTSWLNTSIAKREC
jgi:hypothetical protein